MVVILLVGGCSSPPIANYTISPRNSVNIPISSDFPPHYGDRGGPSQIQSRYNQASSANGTALRQQRKPPPSHQNYNYARTKRLSFSVPQLFAKEQDYHEPHDDPEIITSPPIIRHITKVNICDACSQLEVSSNEANPITREGKKRV